MAPTTHVAQALVALGIAASTLALATAPETASALAHDDYDRAMFELVNEERAAAGIAPLEWFEPARADALGHSFHMDARHEFAHDPQARAEMAALGCTYVGENIFYETKGDFRRGVRSPDPAYALQRYMESPGHRRNVLRPEFRWFVSGTAYDQRSGALHNTQRFAGACPRPAPDSTSRFSVPAPAYGATRVEPILDLPPPAPTTLAAVGAAGPTGVAGDRAGDRAGDGRDIDLARAP